MSDVLEAYNALLGKLSADERGKLQRCEEGAAGAEQKQKGGRESKPGRLNADERAMLLQQCDGGSVTLSAVQVQRACWMDRQETLPRELCFLCAGQWG